MSDPTAIDENPALNEAVPPDPTGSAASAQMTATPGATVPPAHRPGWQTTEFWVSLLTILGIVGTSLASALPPRGAAIAMAVVTVGYSISRGLTKLGTTLFP